MSAAGREDIDQRPGASTKTYTSGEASVRALRGVSLDVDTG